MLLNRSLPRRASLVNFADGGARKRTKSFVLSSSSWLISGPGTGSTPAGVRRERLRVDAQRGLEGGRHVLLDDRPPFARERVAHGSRSERGGMNLDLITASAGRVFVTLAARRGVEQRTEPRLRREYAVEDSLAALEPVKLLAGEAPQRIARFDRLVACRH